jgi:ABC-type polysaccharide/polyol phosphate export permease
VLLGGKGSVVVVRIVWSCTNLMLMLLTMLGLSVVLQGLTSGTMCCLVVCIDVCMHFFRNCWCLGHCLGPLGGKP